jgi:hypothetical protein
MYNLTPRGQGFLNLIIMLNAYAVLLLVVLTLRQRNCYFVNRQQKGPGIMLAIVVECR